MHPKMNDFLTLIQTKTAEHYAQRFPMLTVPRYEVEQGRKYHRVVEVGVGQRSVHCFVDNAGNVYKAAGWKAPAKDVRYTLDELDTIGQKFDPYGGYLYKGARD
jgi:hypothetical protein